VTIRPQASTDSITGLIDTVKEVQIWLNREFSAGLTLDNLYGDVTKKALTKALQKTLGVTADGIYGTKTNAAVKLVRYGSKGTLVSVLQAFLVCNGYKAAYVDGDFGSGTQSALKDFQKKYKLEVDGKAGQETFKSLCS
jgi:peptidoglycan hydrolase-like protein with peptidoglycan-binding domain